MSALLRHAREQLLSFSPALPEAKVGGMTRYEAYVQKGWESEGMAHLVVTRARDDGSADYTMFLVDLFCLGIKDAASTMGISVSEVREMIDGRLPRDYCEPLHPACAKRMIEGALAYAQSLGFAPHRDFRKARKVLSGIDASNCERTFAYGRDGRPCYIRGPDDSEERVSRVCAILEARFGPEGFDYVDLEDDEGDFDEDDAVAVRTELQDFLAAEPADVPRFFELSGLVTALLICPTVLSPLKVLEVLWGSEGREWKSRDEMQGFAHLLMAYWNQLNDLVADAIDPGAPAESSIMDVWEADISDGEDSGLEMAAMSIEWARGFLRATERWPEAWGDARLRPDLAPHWEVLGWWANFEQKENRDRMIAAAESATPRTLNSATKAIARALRPLAGSSPG